MMDLWLFSETKLRTKFDTIKIVEDFFDRESELPLVRQAMEAHFSQKQSLYTKEQFLHKTKMFLQIFIVQLLDPLVSKTK